MSTKGKIVRLLGSVMLKRASVVAAESVGGFRRVVLKGEVPAFAAGAKVQVLLPSDDVRTYTPIAGPGGLSLLGWVHAGGPGARWIAGVQVGEEVQFIGPQRSLELGAGPVIVIGDETSVAVAAALQAERPGQVRAVLCGGSIQDVRAAADSVGLSGAEVVGRGEVESIARHVVAMREAEPGALIAVTGGSELVVACREALRGAGIRDVKAKTYWVPGKTGID